MLAGKADVEDYLLAGFCVEMYQDCYLEPVVFDFWRFIVGIDVFYFEAAP